LRTSALPCALRIVIAKLLAFAAYHSLQRKRRLTEEKLASDEGLGKTRGKAIVKSASYQFWLESLSMPYSSFSIGRFQIDIRGLGFLQTALQRGCGAILWESSYFGRRNLAKQILSHHGFSVVQVHAYDHLGGFGPAGPHESWTTKHIIWPFFDRCERSFLGDIIYLTDTDSLAALRVMLERLKTNAILCLSADGTRGYKFVSVPLFGRMCFFPTGAVSLAKFSGAPMLPIFCYAESDGIIRLEILPALRIRSDGERDRESERAVFEYTNLLRGYVRSYPEQYRNWHHL
jgi:predicted LPLAT superfamily acyltransferase